MTELPSKHSGLATWMLLPMILSVLLPPGSLAQELLSDSEHQLKINLVSQASFSGIAGDFVTVNAQITNTGSQPLTDITTYLSLADVQNKMPVDLEDWNAERGLFIGTIEPHQTFPLHWKIHFVKAGKYQLFMVAILAGSKKPCVSSVTGFDVHPKKNINPGQVIPVALGMPLVLILIFAVVNYQRQKKTRSF